MAHTRAGRLETVLTRLYTQTVERGDAPAEVAEYALAATRAAFAQAAAHGLARRAEAYYKTVIRRRLVRECSGTPHAARLVARSVVDDLLSSGRSTQDAWDELSKGWGHLLTPELSREFQQRLCA